MPPNPHRELPQCHRNAELDEFAAGDNIFKGSVADEHPVLPNFEPHSEVLGGPGYQSLAEVGASPILPRVEGIYVAVSVDIARQIAEPGADKGFNFPVGTTAEEVIGRTDWPERYSVVRVADRCSRVAAYGEPFVDEYISTDTANVRARRRSPSPKEGIALATILAGLAGGLRLPEGRADHQQSPRPDRDLSLSHCSPRDKSTYIELSWSRPVLAELPLIFAGHFRSEPGDGRFATAK